MHIILPTIPSVCCCTTLWKFRSSSCVISGIKCKQKCDMHWFLNTHPILIHLDYLLTCFNFQFLLNIFYKWFYLNKCCELKQRFLHVWHGIDQTITDNAIDEWRGRMRGQKSDTLTRDASVFVKCNTILHWFFGNYHKFELLTSAS